MITPGDPNPNPPGPNSQVCIQFTTSGGATPTAQVTNENGSSIAPSVAANAHPVNSYTLCFNWPSGNTASDVTIVSGSETVTFTVAGLGGP